MRTHQELHDQWKADASLRSEVYTFLQTRGWHHLSRMIELAATESAEFFQRNEADPVLARALSIQKGVRSALYAIQHSCDPDPEPVEKESEPYEHIQESYFTDKHVNPDQ